jgi:hypothetical protein
MMGIIIIKNNLTKVAHERGKIKRDSFKMSSFDIVSMKKSVFVLVIFKASSPPKVNMKCIFNLNQLTEITKL